MRAAFWKSAFVALVALAIACESSGPTDPAISASRISLNSKIVDLGLDEETQLAVSSGDAASVSWKSLDSNVATVSTTGLVSARSIGSTMILATNKKSTDTANVSVHIPIASVKVFPDSVSLFPGKTSQLTFQALDKSGQPISGVNSGAAHWTSNSTSIASVSSSGVVQGNTDGTTRINIDINGKSSSASVLVAPTPVASVSISPSPANVNVGSKVQFAAVVKDSSGRVLSGRQVAWRSADSTTVAVSSTGTATARAVGSTRVTATVDGVSADVGVNANPAVVAAVTVALTASSLTAGQTAQAIATARDSAGNLITGRAVSWSSSRPNVASVSSAGVVTGVAGGTSLIVATVDGVTGASSVTIAAATVVPVATVSVALASSAVALGQTTQATATAKDSTGAVLTGRAVTWSSLNSNVATVNSSGVVTAVAAGTATIRATVDSKTGDASLTSGTTVTVSTVVVALGSASLTAGQTTQAVAVARDASGNVLTGRAVTWQSLSPTIASVSTSGLVTAIAGGSSTIRATVDGKTGDGSVTVAQPAQTPTSTPTPLPVGATDAELPRVYLTTSLASTPSNGRTLPVHAGDNLQKVLDSAQYGDRVVLDACATFVGNFYITARSGGTPGEWITVQSSGQVPPEGTRTSPAMAAAMCYPKLTSARVDYTLTTYGAAARWRFIGIEFTNEASQSIVNGTINLGDATLAQNSLAVTPTDIILDRIYVHSPDNTDDRRCVAANSARTSLIDSYVSNCKSTFDAQAFTTSNGPGPFKVVNNFLESTGENIATGGADTGIPGLVPADFEIRHNYITKRLSWKGTQWVEKNLFESKNGTRILIDGNILENTWVNGQVGYTMALWSANQGGACSQCETSHVTFTNNWVRNVSAGINMTSGIGLFGGAFVPMHHITIRNNLWTGVTNDYGKLFQLDTIPYLTIEHNTALSPNDASIIFGNKGTPAALIIRNNILGGGNYQLTAYWGSGSLAWDGVGGGSGSQWAANVLALAPNWYQTIPSTYYPGTLDEIGFAGGGSTAFSSAATIDQMALSASSAYKGKGTDGRDLGADMAAIKAAVAGVVQP